jgi:uncharacterized protein (TIGR02301 family)
MEKQLMRRSAIAVLVGALILASPAVSATGAAQQALTEAPPPPYEDQLLRLSEILGAVHYLRQLCLADEKDTWRQQMELLLEAEQPDDQRRRRMVDRFNRGYEGFRSVYRTCTAAATESANRYLQEGARISAEITARYGR